MEILGEIIELLLNYNNNPQGLIKKIGIVKKQIGKQYFLAPESDALEAVSISIEFNIVSKVGITFKEDIYQNEIEKMFGNDGVFRYSIYDNISYYNFTLNNDLIIRFWEQEKLNEFQKKSVFRRVELIHI